MFWPRLQRGLRSLALSCFLHLQGNIPSGLFLCYWVSFSLSFLLLLPLLRHLTSTLGPPGTPGLSPWAKVRNSATSMTFATFIPLGRGTRLQVLELEFGSFAGGGRYSTCCRVCVCVSHFDVQKFWCKKSVDFFKTGLWQNVWLSGIFGLPHYLSKSVRT